MSWAFNSIKIFVQSYGGDDKQIIASLEPLNSKTVYHTFGYHSTVIKLKGLIVGNTDLEALKALVQTGVSYTLTGPYSISDSYYLSDLNYELTATICQNLRSDLDSASPVYSVDLELFHDE